MASERIKILVADDDAFIREVLAAILQAGEYTVDTAEDGAGAFAKYCADPGIGLVISDMNMPELDGLGLIKAIRDTGSDVPIIILTGGDDSSLINSGASDYLLKDENISDTIIPMVEKVLEKHAKNML